MYYPMPPFMLRVYSIVDLEDCSYLARIIAHVSTNDGNSLLDAIVNNPGDKTYKNL